MDLISSVFKPTKSPPTSRSNIESLSECLHRLEDKFKELMGAEDGEITLNQFKNIIRSKNETFAERMFMMFDKDKTGTVSLAEFMSSLWTFAQLGTREKLRYLFDIYDLDGDGCIQRGELRRVIRACMEENGLNFSEGELEELTVMLFEDAAGPGDGGCITFEKFEAQLQRHPGLIENICFSLDRWLLPRSCWDTPKKEVFTFHWPRKLSWKYLKNNVVNCAFFLTLIMVHLILFVSRAIEYRKQSIFVILARACGQCLNFDCTFTLVLVLRRSITWLRTRGLSEILPLDHHIYFHKMMGWFILGFSLGHTAMHICNFADLASRTDSNITVPTLDEYLFSIRLDIGTGWVPGTACLTGWLLLLVLLVIITCSLPFVRRSGNFEVFYYTHLLFVPFWILLLIHGPRFWMWFLGPALVFLVESLLRLQRNFAAKAYVEKGVLLPSKVTHLVIRRPPNFCFSPGDYIFVNIPSITRYEWHPFTISSAPELKGEIWLHIRAAGGWTNRLYNYFQKQEKNALTSSNTTFLRKTIRSWSREGRTIALCEAQQPSSGETPPEPADGPNTLAFETSLRPEDAIMESGNGTTTISLESLAIDEDSGTKKRLGPRNGLVLRRNRPVRRVSSIRISKRSQSFRRNGTIILLPTVKEEGDEEEEETASESSSPPHTPTIEDIAKSDEDVVVSRAPLKIYLDGPYGSPSSHMFRSQHAVLIATGIGVTPYASILQSLVHRHRDTHQICPRCGHEWSNALSLPSLRKVDFFWLNRQPRAFEWFVGLLGQLEVEQAALPPEKRILDIHMFVTSALHKTDMKALGLQMALDLLHEKEKRCLITGLKTRTQPGRPDWNKVFKDIAAQDKGKVTVFFCGPPELGKILHAKCNEFGFKFRKENF